MAELTQLRLPHEAEFSWWALGRVVERPLGCSNCHQRINPGALHARGERGERLCEACVASAWKGAKMSATEANRNQRRLRRAHSEARGERMVRMLLDGLEVDSIRELKRLVDVARAFESGYDFLTGRRYAQMHPITDSPILVVYVAAEDVPLSERDERIAADWARIAELRINRDREESHGT